MAPLENPMKAVPTDSTLCTSFGGSRPLKCLQGAYNLRVRTPPSGTALQPRLVPAPHTLMASPVPPAPVSSLTVDRRPTTMHDTAVPARQRGGLSVHRPSEGNLSSEHNGKRPLTEHLLCTCPQTVPYNVILDPQIYPARSEGRTAGSGR